MNSSLDLSSAWMSLSQSLKTQAVEYFPIIANSVIALLAGIVFAYCLRWLTLFIIRTAYKPFKDNPTFSLPFSGNIESASLAFSNIIFFIVLFLAATSFFRRLGFTVLSDWLGQISHHLPRVIVAFVILLFGWKLKSLVTQYLFQSFSRARIDQARSLSSLTGWFVFGVGLMIAIHQFGIDLQIVVPLIAVLGGVLAGGIAFTFALGAKSTVTNILCCHQIKKHLRVGQTVQHCDVRGKLLSIGPTHLVIGTPEGEFLVPGSIFDRHPTFIAKEAR